MKRDGIIEYKSEGKKGNVVNSQYRVCSMLSPSLFFDNPLCLSILLQPLSPTSPLLLGASMKNKSEALRSYLAMSLGRSRKRQNAGKQPPLSSEFMISILAMCIFFECIILYPILDGRWNKEYLTFSFFTNKYNNNPCCRRKVYDARFSHFISTDANS